MTSCWKTPDVTVFKRAKVGCLQFRCFHTAIAFCWIMCSWPITDEVPDVDALAHCALCHEVFPFVNVLSCRRLKGGKLFTCKCSRFCNLVGYCFSRKTLKVEPQVRPLLAFSGDSEGKSHHRSPWVERRRLPSSERRERVFASQLNIQTVQRKIWVIFWDTGWSTYELPRACRFYLLDWSEQNWTDEDKNKTEWRAANVLWCDKIIPYLLSITVLR